MQVGDLNLVNAIVNLEVQVTAQGQLIDKLMSASSRTFSQAEIDEIVNKAKQAVKNKYPALGINFS